MRIAVVAKSDAQLEQLRQLLDGLGPEPPVVSLRRGGLEQIGPAADQEQPDVIILDRLCHNADELAALDGPAARHSGLTYVLIGDNGGPELLRAAMQRGVRDVLAPPVTADALGAAVARIEQRLRAHTAPRHKSVVAAFIACKGGAGATFLAANLAYVLAAECSKSVALLDLDLNVGDAPLFIADHAPATTLADIAQHIERLDSTLLAGTMLRVLPTLGVLAAPDSLEQSLSIKPEHVERVIRLAAADHDCVLIDLGRTFDRVGIKALDLADVIFPVLQLSLPFVRDAKRVLNTLQALGVSDNRIHLIVNRYESDSTLRLADAEQALGRKVALSIPNSYRAVSASVNQGVPMALIAARNAVTNCLRTLASQHFGGGLAADRGWLAKLFRTA
jgi:pilus assembly protein CpaE